MLKEKKKLFSQILGYKGKKKYLWFAILLLSNETKGFFLMQRCFSRPELQHDTALFG